MAVDGHEGLTYRDSGVDIDKGNEVVDRIRKAVTSTHDDGVLAGSHGAFGGFYRLLAGVDGPLEDPVLVGATDGVGTKLKIAFLTGRYDTVGIDLVAMCVNDLIVSGARPLFFLDYVATGAIAPEAIEKIVHGVAEGCRQSSCALLGGETAEMPGFYRDDEFDLAGFAVGVVERKQIIDGDRVEAGDVVVGVSSSGLHSNGFSLVRRALLDGETPLPLDSDPGNLGMTLGEALLVPTRIYVEAVKSVVAASGEAIHAIAHITGGGLLENIPRVLPDALSVRLDRSTWERPAIFELIETRGAVAQMEMDRVFNQGIGLALIVPGSAADGVIALLEKAGEVAQVIGEVTEGEGVVEICG